MSISKNIGGLSNYLARIWSSRWYTQIREGGKMALRLIPSARNFASRHNCDTKNDKTKAGYWACRLPWYAKELGMKGGGRYFW